MTSWDDRRTHAEHQMLLIGFLNTDLDLGFTFASRHNRKSAAEVASAVRRFKDRVESHEARQKIEQRLSDLEKLTSTL
jgi:uncharacterized protein Yka (UPF0111/DUF47 family)